MTPRKPLYQPWSEEEFAADLYVRNMTPVQRWMYRTLLQSAFVCPSRPYLPDDNSLLWMLAGCENPEQWDANKSAILTMFKPIKRKGGTFLWQKRLLVDWERIETKREALAATARNRWNANAEHTDNNSKTDAKQMTCEEKRSEVKKEVKGSEMKQKELNPIRELPPLCRTILGIRPEPIEWRKQDLVELAETYGGNAVVNAFEDWAKTRIGDQMDKPLLEFIKVADGLLSGTVKLSNPTLINLAAALMKAGGQSFTGKHLATLGRLLRDHSADDIINAYAVFTKEKDEFQMKRAPLEFCDGGALQTFALLRNQAADDAKDKERLRALESQSRAESEQRKAQPSSADEEFETGL